MKLRNRISLVFALMLIMSMVLQQVAMASPSQPPQVEATEDVTTTFTLQEAPIQGPARMPPPPEWFQTEYTTEEGSFVERDVAPLRLKILEEKLGLSKESINALSDTEVQAYFENSANWDALGILYIERFGDFNSRERIDAQGVWEKVEYDYGLDITADLEEIAKLQAELVAAEEAKQQRIEQAKSALNPGLNPFRSYLPLVSRGSSLPPVSPPDRDEFVRRLGDARWFWLQLGKYSPPANHYRMQAEMTGFPLALTNDRNPNAFTWPRLSGHYYRTDAQDFCRITWTAVASDHYLSKVECDTDSDWPSRELEIWADRQYHTADPNNVRTVYSVSVRSYTDTEQISLYLGEDLAVYAVEIRVLPYTFQSTRSGFYEANRYTLRHGVFFCEMIHRLITHPTTAGQCQAFLDAFPTITNDIYQAMVPGKLPPNLPEGWFYSDVPFGDCQVPNDGIESHYPWGIWRYYDMIRYLYYAYRSKVCTIGVTPYNLIARWDYLQPALEASYYMNYGGLNYEYCDPRNAPGTCVVKTTPLQTAWRLQEVFNGHGTPVVLKPEEYSSGVRTAVVWNLAIDACYLGDQASCRYADTIANVFMSIMWGRHPNGTYCGTTIDNGYICRPSAQGSIYISWMLVDGRGPDEFAVGLVPAGVLTWISDQFNMPLEEADLIPGNQETNAAFLLAARKYAQMRWGVIWPPETLEWQNEVDLMMPWGAAGLEGYFESEMSAP